MLRVLVTGRNGQVGHALVRALEGRFNVIGCDRSRLDLGDSSSIKKALELHKPDLVINPGAYTAVDLAEQEHEQAFLINHLGPAELAKECSRKSVPLIHFSTDYVFDGSITRPWKESDPTNPLSAYGASKLAGEQSVLEHSNLSIILRTSWVFSSHGQNFLNTMLRLGRERKELSIVDDQHGAPTSANFLANTVSALLPESQDKLYSLFKKNCGIFHLSSSGETTWFGFAQEIFNQARSMNFPLIIDTLKPIPSSQYPTPAIRPKNSRLDCSKFFKTFPYAPEMTWQQALQQAIKEINIG